MSSIPFQASVISNTTATTDVSATNGCLNLLLGDDSNYNATEVGNQLANFTNYRTFTVAYMSGSTFTLSSVTNPPTCSAASTGQLQVNMPITTSDGIYLYTLQTVPSWGLAIPYSSLVHQVYNQFDGNLYTCIGSNTSTALNRPDLAPTLWQLIPPANIFTTLYSKYSAFGYFALSCNAAAGLPTLVQNALCGATGCNSPTFCSSQPFLNAATAFMLYYAVQQSASLGQIQFSQASWNLLNSIIQCP